MSNKPKTDNEKAMEELHNAMRIIIKINRRLNNENVRQALQLLDKTLDELDESDRTKGVKI